MDDKTWEKLRRHVVMDKWVTGAAYFTMGFCFVCSLVYLSDTKYTQAFGMLICTITSYVIAQWHPSLIRIEDVEVGDDD